jgi:hypothetical protein
MSVLKITLRNRLHLLFRDFAVLGPKAAFRYYAARLDRYLLHPNDPPILFPLRLHRPAEDDFDQRFGVNTSEASISDDLRIQSASEKWGLYYLPTPEKLFRRMMQYVRTDLRSYTFMDLGAGKGRALLMASEYPFK